MEDPVDRFVERMGMLLEEEGLPRIAGRLIGFLLLHEAAFSLDELAERLQVSKASVSTNARLLEQAGVLERTSSPGDRRDYYRMGADAWERTLRAAQRRWRTLQRTFDEASETLPPEMETGKQRLAAAGRFHERMIAGVERLLAESRQDEAAGRTELPRRVG